MRQSALVVALCSCLSLGQAVNEKNAPPLTLSAKVPVEGRYYPATLWDPAKCDPQGNIYVRILVPDMRADSPILKVSRDGKQVVRINPRSVPNSSGPFLDLAPAEGGLYTLIAAGRLQGTATSYLIAKFDQGGQWKESTPLDPQFTPVHFALFPSSGNFLIVGTDQRTGTPETKPMRVAALFSPTGHWITNISLRSAEPRSEQSRSSSEAQLVGVEEPLSFAGVRSGEDGTVYIVRYRPLPAVFIVSPDGKVARYDFPNMEEQVRFTDAVIHNGLLLADFTFFRRDANRLDTIYITGHRYFTVDLTSGKTLSTHDVSGSAGGLIYGTKEDKASYIATVTPGVFELHDISTQ